MGQKERRVAHALEVTDATFDAEVVQADKPVIVDFWAPWCAPCRAVGAVLEQLGGERSDLKVVKINIDENQDQAIKHGVMVLPTIVLYKDGEAVGKLQGGVPPTAIARLLNQHVPEAPATVAEEEEPAPAEAEAVAPVPAPTP
jgi:thioredoxin 1